MGRYSNISKLKNTNENVGNIGSTYFKTTFYPEIPLSENDIYVLTDFGDRLDLLANQFYRDISLYWIITSANPNKVNFGSISIPPGTQLRIPININDIIISYNNLNRI
tara:strand:+ start:13876 stop:14199 length:324 start_codon:yes stop_codon:yes gene_type:complete